VFREDYEDLFENMTHFTSLAGPFKFSSSAPLSNVNVALTMSDFGNNCLYFGEMDEGTNDVISGRGVLIKDVGFLEIGNWKDGTQHGWCRYILSD